LKKFSNKQDFLFHNAIYFVFLFNGLFAQNIKVSGKINDTLHNPLPYAKILAIPKADDQDVKFAITEKDGSYKLGLIKKPNLRIYG